MTAPAIPPLIDSATLTEIQDFILAYVRQNRAPAHQSNGLPLEAQLAQSPSLLAAGMLDSLGFIGLFTELETHFQIELDLADQDPQLFTTLSGLSQLCAQTLQDSP